MIEDSDLNELETPYEEAPTLEEPVQEKGPSRAGRLAGIAVLALILIAAVIYLTPSLRNEFFPQVAKSRAAKAALQKTDPDTLASVPILWGRLSLGGMPDSAAVQLRQGKYYYDKRLPGNFGLAIDYWKKAMARLEGKDRDRVQSLVLSAQLELDREFSLDSADAFVLMKQGKQAQAIFLLQKMRADYLDINSPQYKWASRMLYRRIR